MIGELEHRDLLDKFPQGRSELQPEPSPVQDSAPGPDSESDRGIELPPVVTLPVPLKGIFTPDVLRSDHAPFWYQQIPAVLVTDTANLRSPHYHQPSDTLENLDREFFLGSAQVVVNTLAKLLNPDIP